MDARSAGLAMLIAVVVNVPFSAAAQNTKGSCTAAKEIDKRTKGGAPVSMF